MAITPASMRWSPTMTGGDRAAYLQSDDGRMTIAFCADEPLEIGGKPGNPEEILQHAVSCVRELDAEFGKGCLNDLGYQVTVVNDLSGGYDGNEKFVDLFLPWGASFEDDVVARLGPLVLDEDAAVELSTLSCMKDCGERLGPFRNASYRRLLMKANGGLASRYAEVFPSFLRGALRHEGAHHLHRNLGRDLHAETGVSPPSKELLYLMQSVGEGLAIWTQNDGRIFPDLGRVSEKIGNRYRRRSEVLFHEDIKDLAEDVYTGKFLRPFGQYIIGTIAADSRGYGTVRELLLTGTLQDVLAEFNGKSGLRLPLLS